MERWFTYLHEKSFKRIYGSTSDDDISYFYSPHASVDTKIQLLPKLTLPNVLRDFNGFTIRSNLIRMFPLTFVYPDTKGHEQIGGFSGQMFMHFLRKHNAIYKEIPMQNTTKFHFWELIRAVSKGQIDLSINVFSLILPLVNNTESIVAEYSCYFGKIEEYRIMVAINGFVQPDEYFLRPFDGIVWICIGLTLIYITAFDIIWKLGAKLQVDIWNSFTQIFLNILNLSPERPITSAYRLHAQVSLFAFIVGNIYVIYFTSYLTAYIPIKQYDTIQDLVDNNISVMISQSKWTWLRDKVPYSASLENIILPVDYDTLYAHLLPMKNKSIAYILNIDEAKLFLEFHSRFDEPMFRIAPEAVFPEYFLIYLMPRHSPLKEILDHFILQIMETGLMKRWKSDVVLQLVAAGFKKFVNRSTEAKELLKPLTLEHQQQKQQQQL
ncbi:uncharacterized protein LOC129944837 [Eupeodes corollae]|uniref:uncharacterized protein LOC129944837 n=1 Tax=Eupeodes corollae TaxID=290404 RepID=UPI002493095C|nr:uncharacterized protein LOC129944837 [Eupeodes corollae]